MKIGLFLRAALSAVLLALAMSAAATDSNIGDTSGSSHDIAFCNQLAAPYSGCAAAALRTQADTLKSPVAIYEYVRNSYEFALYHGARAGAINAFAGGRGNDVDLAATLISMLRSQGFPARYAVGTVQVPALQAANWLRVLNPGLAGSLLSTMGIQLVGFDATGTLLSFEHTWVEVLVPYGEYRGAGGSSINCVTTPTACDWVPLDPSFKQHGTQSSGLDPYAGTVNGAAASGGALSFDFNSYYNAILNQDTARQNRNPLEIYQDQVRAWLAANAPGAALTAIADFTAPLAVRNGLLPASLPFALVNAPRRYNSVADHDSAVAAGIEAANWNKYVTGSVQFGTPNFATVPGGVTVSLIDAATQRLTLSFTPLNSGYVGTFRLNGTAVGTAVNAGGAATINGEAIVPGAALKVLLSMDGIPAVAGSVARTVTATYDGVVGGYYLVATGGETSNWSQVHSAAQAVLAASQQYPIVYNPADPGMNGQPCNLANNSLPIGLYCTPYVDVNHTGSYVNGAPTLLSYEPALDALTGGLLQVAGQQYFTNSREKLSQLDDLNRMRSPIVGFLGLVASTQSVQYLDGTAFSVQPSGLLVDMKGMAFADNVRIDTGASSAAQFKLGGHILSSLEHETWQQLTGFDAISTVRGTQIALANGGSLIDYSNDGAGETLTQAYPSFGFTNSVPSGFTQHSTTLFGATYTSWGYGGNASTTAGFEAILANSSGLAAGDSRLAMYSWYANNGIDGLLSNFSSTVATISSWQAQAAQLQTNFTFTGSGFTGQDVAQYSTDSSSASGFAVVSATRNGTDTYQFVVNETAAHAPGTYSVKADLLLSNGNNNVTYTYSYPYPISLKATPTASTAGFNLQAWSQPNSTSLTFTVQQTSGHADGTYSVPISSSNFTYNNIPGYSGQIATVSIQVAGGRVVDGSSQITLGFTDHPPASYTCQVTPSAQQTTYTGQPSDLMADVQSCFNSTIAANNLGATLSFFNQPISSLVFRPLPLANVGRPASIVTGERDTLDLPASNVSSSEYHSPSIVSSGASFTFAVDFLDQTYSSGSIAHSASYLIANENGVAGGGYVTASDPLIPAESIDPASFGGLSSVSAAPTFVNSVFTDQVTTSTSNNNLIITPSTTDPVSTVTGNNFHDETDFQIKGRGLNLAFTRTYNSAASSTRLDLGLGYGWVHSYGMQLMSNDFGRCPDCTSAQAPENGNKLTSSITYTDERGGAHTYLVSEATGHGVTPPAGEFDTLSLDSPAPGLTTLTFRNGTRYVFQSVPAPGNAVGDIKVTPGVVGRLMQIADPYGNVLNFTYTTADTSGRLASVKDNLGIATRTGLVFSYDATGHLKSIADWSGRLWQYSVNAAGQLASYSNALQQVTSYGYSGRLLLTVAKPLRGVKTTFSYYQNGRTFNDQDALGDSETLDYDLFSKATRVADPRGNVRQYEYDGSGHLSKLTEADGAVLTFGLTATDGLRASKSNGLGYVTQYSYASGKGFGSASDTGGNVTREQDALGQNVDTTYGIYDQIASVTDKRGTTITNSYFSAAGTCAVIGKPQSTTISSLSGVANVKLVDYCWNPDGTLASKTEYIDPANAARKRTTSYAYQAGSSGLNVQTVTVSGASSGGSTVTSYTYDALFLGRMMSETVSRVTSATNPALINLTTSYGYDALDRVTGVTDPLGNTMTTVFDANGKVYQIIGNYQQSNGTFVVRTLSTRTYDAADRLAGETDVLGNVTTYGYDAAGNVIAILDAENHTTRYDYDAMNRRTGVTDGNGYRTQSDYDRAGQVIAVTNPNGETTVNGYDAIGRLVSVTDPKGYVTRYRYDGNGNRTCTIDANAQAGLQPTNSDGCSESRSYDELNRLTQVKDALGNVTTTAYDLLGHAIRITDAAGKITSYGYDDLGRQISMTDPLLKSTIMTWDQTGNELTLSNRLNQVTRTTYDALNRPTLTEYLTDGTTETKTYDVFGNLATVANANVTYTLGYDNKNRLQSKLDSRSNRTLSFTYDRVGNIASKTDFQGHVTTFRYDSANHVVGARNPDFIEATYQHDAAGRILSRILSNGAISSYTYDADGFLTTLMQKSADGTVQSSASYVRDRLGNITTKVDQTGTTTYVYDAVYRLTSASYPGTNNAETFSYDAVGNRQVHTLNGTVHAYEYVPGSNRLKAVHTGTLAGAVEKGFSYDDEGGLRVQTGTGAKILTWDQKRRASSMAAGAVTLTPVYDPMDYRIGTRGSSLGTRDYYLEGEHLEAIYSGSSIQAKYFRGLATDELIASWQFDPKGNWGPYIYHHDNEMNVTAVSSETGAGLETTSYSAFGNLLSDTGSTSNELKYTARELDPDTGLYYYRARYYDPTIGRFVSEDPKGFAAGINWYAYAGSNPVNFNDPSGFDQTCQCSALTFSAVGPNQATGIGALRISPPNDSVAISPSVFGLPYDTIPNRVATQNALIKNIPNIRINAPGLADYLTGSTTFTIGDVGDQNIRNSPTPRFDIYRFETQQDALGFGKQTVPGTITGVPDSWSCPASCTAVPSYLPNGGTLKSPAPQSVAPTGPQSLNDDGAAGGFLLYPNKPNNSQLQSVYNK